MTDTPPPEEAQTRPFAAVLQALQQGKTHRELSDKLQDLVGAVKETGRAGTLTLKLKVSPSKVGGALEIDDTVTTSIPEPKRDASLFFVDRNNNLVRDNPAQTELDLSPVRVVNRSEGAAAQ